jgi:alanine racemase
MFSPSVAIDLDNLLHNLQQTRSRLPSGIGVIAVVKDSAYGCGAAIIARFLEEEGDIHLFAVARSEEAFTLRENGIRSDILILGKVPPSEFGAIAAGNFTLTCNDLDDLHHWQALDIPIRFHCNIDTGMHRLGLHPETIPELITLLRKSRHLRCEGVFTHMASADVPDTGTVEDQYRQFTAAVAMFNENGIAPACVHIANSAAILRHPHHGCTHVRPGIMLYGSLPDPKQNFGLDLRPVLSLKGTIVALRSLPAGSPVSYGGNYTTSTDTTIATIGVGYAHGVPRYLSNRGSVLIGGNRYTIAGNVTMDYIMADVGPAPSCAIGDEAVVIGSQGESVITPDEVAAAGNTIAYEVLCNIGRALPRSYIRNGGILEQQQGHSF